MEFNISGSKVIFFPSEYVFFGDKKEALCRFGSTYHLRHFHYCQEDTDFAVSKMFLQKISILLSFQDEKIKMSFYKKSSKKKQNYFWYFVGFLSMFLFILMIISILMMKKKQQEEQFYEEI